MDDVRRDVVADAAPPLPALPDAGAEKLADLESVVPELAVRLPVQSVHQVAAAEPYKLGAARSVARSCVEPESAVSSEPPASPAEVAQLVRTKPQ